MPQPPKNLALGYLELTLSQCCVGIGVISGKYLLALFPALWLLLFRSAVGFVGMLVLARKQQITCRSVTYKFLALPHRDKLLLIFQVACGGLIFNLLMLYGMQTTTALAAGIISSITPIMIFILATLLFRERITLPKMIAIILVCLGLLILNEGKNTGNTQSSLLGNLLILLAVVPEALFVALSKIVSRKMSGTEAALLSNFMNFVFVFPFALLSMHALHMPPITLTTGLMLLVYGSAGSFFFFIFWFGGVAKVNSHTTALFTGVMPISTTLLAVLFLHESLHMQEFLGMCLVIAAILIGCGWTQKTVSLL